MTKYNPEKHHRRSVRLRNYDYSQNGLYFVTICVKNGECLFGEIVVGANGICPEMKLNELGKIVEKEWLESAKIRKEINIHEYIVMPNHFHAIVEITDVGANGIRPINKCETVGANGIRPINKCETVGANGIRPINKCETVGTNTIRPKNNNSITEGECHSPLRVQQRPIGTSKTIGALVRGFKSSVTKQIGFSPWQRSFHEHIIRDRNAHARIAEYIVNNPINWGKDKFYKDKNMNGFSIRCVAK